MGLELMICSFQVCVCCRWVLTVCLGCRVWGFVCFGCFCGCLRVFVVFDLTALFVGWV